MLMTNIPTSLLILALRSNGNRIMVKIALNLILFGILFFSSGFATADDNWARSYRLESNRQYVEAAKAIEIYLKQTPDNLFAELRSGWLYYLAGNYSRSIKHYQTALQLNSTSIEAPLGLTLPLLAQGRWREAAAQANKVIAVSKWNYYAHIRLMACEEGLKMWDDLLKHAREVQKRYPSDATVLVYLARAYKNTGESTKAKQIYEEVLTRVPGHIESSQFVSQ